MLDINIFDDDLNPNDMVDTISLSFSGITTTSGYSQSVGHTGRCDKSTIQLRYRISCAQGFEGPRCDCVSEPGTYICDVNGIRRCVEIQFAAPPECVECIEGYHGPRCDCMDQPGQYTCNPNGTRQCIFPFTGLQCTECVMGYYGPRCDRFCLPEPEIYTCNGDGTRQCVIQFAAPPGCVECIEGYIGPKCDCMDQPGQYTCNLNGTRQCTFPFTGPLCDDCVSGYSGQTCNCTDQPGRYTCNFDGTVNCTGNFTTESLCTTCLLDHYKNDCSVYCSTLNFPGYKCDVDGILVYICESFIDPRCSKFYTNMCIALALKLMHVAPTHAGMTTIIYIVIACFTLLPGLLCLCFIVVAQVNKKRNKDTY